MSLKQSINQAFGSKIFNPYPKQKLGKEADIQLPQQSVAKNSTQAPLRTSALQSFANKKPANSSPISVSSMMKSLNSSDKPINNPATISPRPPISAPAEQSKVEPYGGVPDANDPAMIGGRAMEEERQKAAVPEEENATKLQLDALRKTYLGTLTPSAEETTLDTSLSDIASKSASDTAAARAAYAQRVGAINEQSTLQPFLTGRQAQASNELANQLAAIQSSTEAQTLPLSEKLAKIQEQRELSRKRAEGELDFFTSDQDRIANLEKERQLASQPIQIGDSLIDPITFKPLYSPRQSPVELSEGSTLIDPETGEVIYINPKTYKSSGSGGGYGGALSALAQSVFTNPSLLSTLTPTLKSQILSELAAAGQDLSRFGLQNLGSAEREKIALFDEIENEANFADALYQKNTLNTGPIAGHIGTFGQKIGTTGQDFTNLSSILSNMISILLRMRSGAAVTPQEFERIQGFIPSIYEDEKTAKAKISRFYSAVNSAKQNYINRQTQPTYSIITQPQSGYNNISSNDPLGIR